MKNTTYQVANKNGHVIGLGIVLKTTAEREREREILHDPHTMIYEVHFVGMHNFEYQHNFANRPQIYGGNSTYTVHGTTTF